MANSFLAIIGLILLWSSSGPTGWHQVFCAVALWFLAIVELIRELRKGK